MLAKLAEVYFDSAKSAMTFEKEATKEKVLREISGVVELKARFRR